MLFLKENALHGISETQGRDLRFSEVNSYSPELCFVSIFQLKGTVLLSACDFLKKFNKLLKMKIAALCYELFYLSSDCLLQI